MKNNILETISNATLEEILDVEDLNNMDWIWINRSIFQDIFLNLKIEEIIGEEKLEKFISEIEDTEVINCLQKVFKNRGYVSINQFMFSMAETGFKPTKDIKTTIFIKEKSYRKLIIKLTNEFDWMLKAMAVDTFLKMSTQFKNTEEGYKELYEENSMIIEALLSNEEHTYLTGRWKFERKTKELLFLKGEEIYQSWAEGEAETRFREATNK